MSSLPFNYHSTPHTIVVCSPICSFWVRARIYDKEVWRCSSVISEHGVDESSAPDANQHEVYGLQSSGTDGFFQPWAVLHMPELTSAYHFVYPTLVAAAYDRAYLWDIPSGKLIQTIEECQFIASKDGNSHMLFGITYVEISERHVFIAGQFYLRVFSRATGKNVLNFSSSVPGGYGLEIYADDLTWPNSLFSIGQIRDRVNTGTV